MSRPQGLHCVTHYSLCCDWGVHIPLGCILRLLYVATGVYTNDFIAINYEIKIKGGNFCLVIDVIMEVAEEEGDLKKTYQLI